MKKLTEEQKKRMEELAEKAHNEIDMDTLIDYGLSKEEAEEYHTLAAIELEYEEEG